MFKAGDKVYHKSAESYGVVKDVRVDGDIVLYMVEVTFTQDILSDADELTLIEG